MTDPGEGPMTGITMAELALAARNHGMPLEALRYDITPVGPAEHDLDGVRADPGLLEHGSQGGAGPLGRPHRLLQPGLADRPRVQPSPAVAGAARPW